MFSSVDESSTFYNSYDPQHRNRIIYEGFHKNALDDSGLCCFFNNTTSYGELPFCWSWKLLVDEMPHAFKFLEIGINNGRMLSTVAFLSQREQKDCLLYGVKPISQSSDKDDMYSECITNNYAISNCSVNNLNIINGMSQDANIIEQVRDNGPYDIVFINGFYTHDSTVMDEIYGINRYDNIVQDVNNYSSMLSVNGYFIMNDASIYIGNPYGESLGDPDMSAVSMDITDNMTNFVKMYNIGHNRVWKKIS
jgi:hypothetical protein